MTPYLIRSIVLYYEYEIKNFLHPCVTNQEQRSYIIVERYSVLDGGYLIVNQIVLCSYEHAEGVNC